MLKTLQILTTAGLMAAGVFFFPTSSKAEEVTIKLSVPDMNCPACPITVRKSLERVDGVLKAETFIETQTAVVTFDDGQTNVAALIEATTNFGYPSILIDADS